MYRTHDSWRLGWGSNPRRCDPLSVFETDPFTTWVPSQYLLVLIDLVHVLPDLRQRRPHVPAAVVRADEARAPLPIDRLLGDPLLLVLLGPPSFIMAGTREPHLPEAGRTLPRPTILVDPVAASEMTTVLAQSNPLQRRNLCRAISSASAPTSRPRKTSDPAASPPS